MGEFGPTGIGVAALCIIIGFREARAMYKDAQVVKPNGKIGVATNGGTLETRIMADRHAADTVAQKEREIIHDKQRDHSKAFDEMFKIQRESRESLSTIVSCGERQESLLREIRDSVRDMVKELSRGA